MSRFEDRPVLLSRGNIAPVLILAASCPPAPGGVVGGTFGISGGGCRFPDAAYSSQSAKYLVVWADYNETRVHGRLVSPDGVPLGPSFPISEEPYGALFPAVTYAEASDEFLVTWDDFGGRGEVIHGQRVRASDGILSGANFRIGSVAGGIRSAVAFSEASGVYLVVYFVPGAGAEIFGQRVSQAGGLLGANFNISDDAIFSGYPAVSWGEAGDQFLVTWDHEDGNILGRRVAASTGGLLGSTIQVTTGGGKDRSAIAYDPGRSRWLVQWNDVSHAGFSYDQWARLVDAGGIPIGGLIPIAHSTAFEGDTQFGGDVAFGRLSERFFSSFGTDSGMAGQESLGAGDPAAPAVTLGTGFYTSLNNAADARRNRFLTAWEGMVGGTYQVFGRLYAATLAPPGGFTAEAGDSEVILSWKNSLDPQLTGTLIRYKTTGYPTGPGDGEQVDDRRATPGSQDGFRHPGLINDTTYYYAAFAHDDAPNHSPAARAAATPRSPPASVIHHGKFDTGDDGWTLEIWRAGASSFGAITRDAAAGNILTAGSGATNNHDSCTREGGTMTRVISTAGRSGIQIEYDVEAAPSPPLAPSGGGNCPVLEGGIEDKLVVSVSAAGLGGPWSTVEVLTEGAELPTSFTRRLINLSGVPEVDDNPDFAVRFKWQFNHQADAGRIDDVRILSGAVTGPGPGIGLSPTGIERTIEAGDALSPISLWVWNTGGGILDFMVSEDAPWLSVTPEAASSAGPPRRIELAFSTSTLSPGDHLGEARVSSPGATGDPRTSTILLHVLPRGCLRERFEYPDGELTTMGKPSWSGSATQPLAVEGGVLRISGGAGAVSATRAVACPGAGSLRTVDLKIRQGPGTGEFFWNLAIDDDAGGNLARFYGGNDIARGRIGGSITADMLLTGGWNHLLALIDTSAHRTEFFFNGVSFGSIAHGAGATSRIGSIRIERLDRVGAESGAVFLDDLTVLNASPRLFHRGDPDASGSSDLTDVLGILNYLFLEGAEPACADSGDSNDDGRLDLSDCLSLLFYLFADGPPPSAPGPVGSPCGEDPGLPGSPGSLGCRRYQPCGTTE